MLMLHFNEVYDIMTDTEKKVLITGEAVGEL